MKKPYALLFNDIHADKDNLNEFCRNWDEALSVAKSKGISRMIIGGDLFQARAAIPLSVIKAVHFCIKRTQLAGVEICIIRGNHDLVDQEDTYSYCNIFGEMDGVKVIEKWDVLKLDDKTNLFMCGYYPEDGTATEKIAEMEKEIDTTPPDSVNILYCHWGISGALSRPSSAELPVKAFRAFDRVLVGHYHDRCRINNSNVEYIGASRQANYGEDEAKGYTVLYDDGSTEFIQNEANIRYMTIESELETVDEDIRNVKELDDPQYRVKVKLHVPVGKEADKKGLIDAGVAKVEIVNEDIEVQETTEYNLEAKFDKAGIKEEYVKDCEENDVDPQLGIYYLDKI